MEPFSHTLTAQLHDQEHHVRLVFFEEKANDIFRSKKEKNPAAQSCREAKNLQLCAAGIFYFGPFRVVQIIHVTFLDCMSPILAIEY